MSIKAYRFQLRTRPAVEAQLRRYAGIGRQVWNRALAEQRPRHAVATQRTRTYMPRRTSSIGASPSSRPNVRPRGTRSGRRKLRPQPVEERSVKQRPSVKLGRGAQLR
ncbi:helix-turn-helix domain-containing protein [Paucibacter soli]|uniref:helix-turn-helix domain-containing protein n=1 Tax=Paucibacter soli TaxID=3133433 RepID=UPI0040364632